MYLSIFTNIMALFELVKRINVLYILLVCTVLFVYCTTVYCTVLMLYCTVLYTRYVVGDTLLNIRTVYYCIYCTYTVLQSIQYCTVQYVLYVRYTWQRAGKQRHSFYCSLDASCFLSIYCTTMDRVANQCTTVLACCCTMEWTTKYYFFFLKYNHGLLNITLKSKQ